MKNCLAKSKVIWLVISIILVLGLQSCIRRQYKIQIENRTNYSIDSVNYYMGNKHYSLALASGQSSDIMTTSRRYTLLNLFFGAGGLGMDVTRYSDADSTYTNNIGSWWDAEALSYKKLNKFVITESDSSPNNGRKFHIKLE